MKLTPNVKSVALENGADLVGITSTEQLSEHQESIDRLLPAAKRVVVVVSRHSLAAISSKTNEVGQFDTIHTYNETARACHSMVRFLEELGHSAVAVPAFIPLDMSENKKGMKGEVSWRQAGYKAGLGSYGENGLLVTEKYGSAIRLAGILTDAELELDSPLKTDACDHCMECVTCCPPKALLGNGKIDKKKCGDYIFRYGFRYFQGFMASLFTADKRADRIINGRGLRELWQNFMTGNYYYCFNCQTKCHQKGPQNT